MQCIIHPQVLENRCGIPISMALVYMEVAQRCKFPMLGLNMPAHFMLTPLVRGAPVKTYANTIVPVYRKFHSL